MVDRIADILIEDHVELMQENKRLRELLWRWMSTQEGGEPVTPELLEETDATLAEDV
jgi:hypothetical protein